MKKYKTIGLVIGILLLCLSLFSMYLVKVSYEEEANKNLNNLVAFIKEKNPDFKSEDLIKALSTDKDLDLEKFGIYKNRDLLDLRESKNRALITALILSGLFALILSLYFYMFSKNQKNSIFSIIEDMEKINRGIYNIKINNEEEDIARLQNEMFKTTVKLKEEAENANKIKDHLRKSLEDISHQIKTPIASINLLLENLQDPEIDESDKKEILSYINIEVEAITGLVLTLLNISLIESETIEFKREEIVLGSLIDRAIDILEPLRRDKGLRIFKSLGDISYKGDPKWECEMYLNLIRNAFEHSKSDEIRIYAIDTNAYFEVTIENASDPIPKEIQGKLFDRFFKLSSVEGSYGIGLNLCKMIAESNNAKLRMEYKDDTAKFIVRYYKGDI